MIYKRRIIPSSINKWLFSFQRHLSSSSPSSTKDHDLEHVLTRNRRWIVNNQIKNFVLKFPNGEAPVNFIQNKFPALGLRGDALKWLKKYPCCFELYDHAGGGRYLRLTKRLNHLIDEEERMKDGQEPVIVTRLTKLLLLSRNKTLGVMKLNNLRHSFGLPDDYLIRLTTKHPEKFRITQNFGGRTSVQVELLSWDPQLAVSSVEASATAAGVAPQFQCCMPLNWVKSARKFDQFNRTPYVSPYSDPRGFADGSEEMEKRAVGMVHELLTLTLWKKASIFKMGHFRWEFALPEKLGTMLLRHPGIFYVSNRYKLYTVVLRECFNGGEMVDKDPLVAVKEKFGELMQEGLHEYNQRHRVLNLEKKQRRLRASSRPSQEKVVCGGGDQRLLFCDVEERKRFYDVLFHGD